MCWLNLGGGVDLFEWKCFENEAFVEKLVIPHRHILVQLWVFTNLLDSAHLVIWHPVEFLWDSAELSSRLVLLARSSLVNPRNHSDPYFVVTNRLD